MTTTDDRVRNALRTIARDAAAEVDTEQALAPVMKGRRRVATGVWIGVAAAIAAGVVAAVAWPDDRDHVVVDGRHLDGRGSADHGLRRDADHDGGAEHHAGDHDRAHLGGPGRRPAVAGRRRVHRDRPAAPGPTAHRLPRLAEQLRPGTVVREPHAERHLVGRRAGTGDRRRDGRPPRRRRVHLRPALSHGGGDGRRLDHQRAARDLWRPAAGGQAGVPARRPAGHLRASLRGTTRRWPRSSTASTRSRSGSAASTALGSARSSAR